MNKDNKYIVITDASFGIINVILPKNHDFYTADLDSVNDKMIKSFSTWTQKDI